MTRSLQVAVVGATGLVGETMIRILEERKFPISRLVPLASARSSGKTISFRGESIPVQDLATFDFAGTDLAFFSAGGAVSKQFVPKASEKKCLVIDNTSHFRYEKDIPLVVPEVNPEKIHEWKNRYIIANPNCSTIQMLVALYPLHKAAEIKRIQVATYQSVSGAGRKAIEELVLNKTPEVFPYPIAYNAIPHIDQFQENGYTKEEMKMVWETHKIMDAKVEVNPTTVRIPVQIGHSEVVAIEMQKNLSPEEARAILSKSPGVVVQDEHSPKGYPTPLMIAGTDPVYVGRIRQDLVRPNGLNMWIVADNIRKGAALNSIQIAELWLENYLK